MLTLALIYRCSQHHLVEQIHQTLDTVLIRVAIADGRVVGATPRAGAADRCAADHRVRVGQNSVSDLRRRARRYP